MIRHPSRQQITAEIYNAWGRCLGVRRSLFADGMELAEECAWLSWPGMSASRREFRHRRYILPSPMIWREASRI